MASSDGSTPIDPAEAAAPAARRRARTAAEQRHDVAATSNDPEVLAAEIERTREELAGTLDAIADKVSPKRVAGRTKKKVGDAVKDGAEGAAATVKAGASAVKEAAVSAKEAVEDKTNAKGDADDGALATLPAASPYVTGASGLHPVPPPTAGPRIGPPALAGAVAAVVVALFVLRRRRR